MYCLPARELRERFHDDNVEVRRAAVRTCGQRREEALVPDLITLLDDKSKEVAKQAHQVLRDFASRDFGPSASADPNKRRQAIAAWQNWWQERRSKRSQTQPDS
jgi:HEAT repeat protein